MPDAPPAILIADAEGNLVETNLSAEHLLGDRPAGSCRELLERQNATRDLPCDEHCTELLVGRGIERARRSRILLQGKPATLTCTPSGDKVVCLVSPDEVNARGPWEQLTPREVQVLKEIAEGNETPAIAQTLGVSEATVRTHVQHMRQKLGVATRAGIVAKAFRMGWLR